MSQDARWNKGKKEILKHDIPFDIELHRRPSELQFECLLRLPENGAALSLIDPDQYRNE